MSWCTAKTALPTSREHAQGQHPDLYTDTVATTGNCRLVVVSGTTGSGKITTASFIEAFLEQKSVPDPLYCESDPEHPADFEGTARFTRPHYESFLAGHATQRRQLERNAIADGNDWTESRSDLAAFLRTVLNIV